MFMVGKLKNLDLFSVIIFIAVNCLVGVALSALQILTHLDK